MHLPNKFALKIDICRVYKTGIAFYDAARLIGVAHLLFGTASAEVEDKGAFWEIRGIKIHRNRNQVDWVIDRLKPTQREKQLFNNWDDLVKFFLEHDYNQRGGRRESLKAEYDAAVQIGTRGIDPLAKYEVLAPRSTRETKKHFKDHYQEIAAATLGRAFAAKAVSRTKRQAEEMYILPVFRERFVLSGFLEYNRSFSHPSSGKVAAIWASLSILLDLTAKRLPVVDFVYTREVKGPTRQPIFSDSGYLGLEHLCTIWWRAVQENDEGILNLLWNFQSFLNQTKSSDTDEQVQSLARWIADFLATPNADALAKIEQLKARIRAASQSQNKPGYYAANQLLSRSEIVKEVSKMMQLNLPEVPWQVSEALARALGFDEKGWMNQFTRLENAPNFSQFIQQVEHIISRGYYREQQEQGGRANIREALNRARDLANSLRGITSSLQDEKTFRAWKAIFLLDVLSRMRISQAPSEAIEMTATEGVEEIQT